MERPRDSSDFISRTRSLLAELDNLSDEEEPWFEDNQVMKDSTTLSSHNTYESIVERASITEPKLQQKPSPKIEHRTELDLSTGRFTDGEPIRRLQLNKMKRSNEDFNTTSEAILNQQAKRIRYSHSPTHFSSPTHFNSSTTYVERSPSYSHSNQNSNHNSSMYNELNRATTVEYHDHSPSVSANNNNNMMNNNNDDHESFLGYKPPTDEVPNPPRSDEIIQVKQHKYRIIRSIGEGGSGKVYQVLSLTHMDIFALKWIILRDDLDVENVKNEIKIMKELMSCRHVVNLCDSEITAKVAYMVMEYGSATLGHLIQSQIKRGWDITFFVYYWKQMLKAVEATHQHNIIHADLKPANFVVVDGCLKLIDFGIADKIPDFTTNIGRQNQVGTANFMAPESLVDANIDTGGQPGYKQGRPSDVWSLGCILYQMIYSKPPFFHLPRNARIGAIINVNHEILIPENVKYGDKTIAVPNVLRNLLQLCLNRNTQLRPTLKELLAHPFISIHN